jgi:chemotaxis protein methyltransferase CheR
MAPSSSGRLPVDDPADQRLARLLEWVTSQTGLSFRGQRESATDILRRAIKRSGDADADGFRRRLAADRAAFDDLIGELTIGETYFFRDRGQFELIANDFFQHVDRIRPADHQIRIWSAGCASGEEAWSLAVLLAESGLSHRGRVLGTDISRPSLRRAQLGQYNEWSLRGDAMKRMRPWTNAGDEGYTIVPQLRPLVSFEYLNLAEDIYPSFATNTIGMDLILCRNVLIYFNQETITRVAQRLFRSLGPGGWLIAGASDPPLHQYAPFEVSSTAIGRLYVRPASGPLPTVTSGGESEQSKHDRHTRSSPVPRPPVPGDVDRPPPIREARHEAIAGQVDQGIEALRLGNYDRVLELTEGRLDDDRLCALRVRALANLDVEQAERFCRQALTEHRLSTELNYLYTVLLTELSRYREAAAAAKRLVFLDHELAVGQMALGTALHRLGNLDGARRAFRSAQRICQAQPTHALVPLGDGEQAGRLAESAARHLSLLGDSGKRDSTSWI